MCVNVCGCMCAQLLALPLTTRGSCSTEVFRHTQPCSKGGPGGLADAWEALRAAPCPQVHTCSLLAQRYELLGRAGEAAEKRAMGGAKAAELQETAATAVAKVGRGRGLAAGRWEGWPVCWLSAKRCPAARLPCCKGRGPRLHPEGSAKRGTSAQLCMLREGPTAATPERLNGSCCLLREGPTAAAAPERLGGSCVCSKKLKDWGSSDVAAIAALLVMLHTRLAPHSAPACTPGLQPLPDGTMRSSLIRLMEQLT